MSFLHRPYNGMMKYPTYMSSYVLRNGITKSDKKMRVCEEGNRGKRFRMRCTNVPESVRCYVNSEGHLVCERLEPGDYVVKSKNVLIV